MASRVRFQRNSRGFDALLKSSGVRADLQRRGDAVKRAAEPQYSGRDLRGTDVQVIADTYVGKTRAGATVIAIHPAAMAIERKHRVLGSSMDAASD